MGETLYRLMESSDKPLLEWMSGRKDLDGWPIVVAERENEGLVGFIATRKRYDLVEVSAWYAESPWIALRLSEAYENLLWGAGVTEYRFAVQKLDDHMMALMAKVQADTPGQFVPYYEDEVKICFVRRLEGGITYH